MKNIELIESFEIELDKLDDNLTKPTTNITEYWLNQGLEKFWKTRYSLMNTKREAFEQTQKRIDDLRTLVTDYTFTKEQITTVHSRLYTVELRQDYLILLGDTVGISPATGVEIPCWPKEDDQYIIKYADTIEGTVDTIDRIKENSLSEYHLHYANARPIRLVANNLIKLHTDGKYMVSVYTITYLRKPNKIDIHTNPFEQYTDMPEHTLAEIVKLAAQMYLENQKDQRYQTYSNEVSSME